jgi:transcriptional regulator with XRE-family HTH domain
LERGQSAPGIDLVEHLATALGVSISDLLPTETTDPSAMLTRRVEEEMDAILQKAGPADLNLLASMLALFKRDLSRRRSE